MIETVPVAVKDTVLLAYRGSIAHGMYVPNTDPNSIDDVDIMGVVIAPIEHYFGLTEWGSRGTKEVKQDKWDCVYYEIKKFVSLLLQGNPNVLSMLWLHPDHYLELEGPGRLLVGNKHLFVGKHVYNAFAGYAHAQLLKMETRDPADLRMYLALTAEAKHRGIHPNEKGIIIPYPDGYDYLSAEARVANTTHDEKLLQMVRAYQKKGENIGYLGDKRKHLILQHGYDSKNAAHLVRLLRMAKEFLATGSLEVLRHDAAELLEIKRGKWALEDVKRLADQLFAEIKVERDKSPLPEQPDRASVEKLVVCILKEWFRSPE